MTTVEDSMTGRAAGPDAGLNQWQASNLTADAPSASDISIEVVHIEALAQALEERCSSALDSPGLTMVMLIRAQALRVIDMLDALDRKATVAHE